MAWSRNIKIVYGMVQADVKLTPTKATSTESLTQLCTGEGKHDPIVPCWDPVCQTCGPVKRNTLAKGNEVAKGQYVVFSQDEVAQLKGDSDQYKGILTLSAHNAVEVEGQVMPSGTSYYIEPGKGDSMFPLLKLQIDENPDLAFMGLYTVTSAVGRYRVRSYDGILIAEQILAPEEIATTPVVTLTDVPEAMVDTVREVARKFVTPFDASTYANNYAKNLAAATAAREAQAAGGLTPGPLADTIVTMAKAADPMAAMLAMMAATVADDKAPSAPVAPKAKRAPRKKAAAAPEAAAS
jgi:non-homologous end joining protein Ku